MIASTNTPQPWTAFDEMTDIVAGDGRRHEIPAGFAIFKNSRYLVWKSTVHCQVPLGDGVLLSIRALDRSAAHNWRDFQRLKNELVGPEAEAVELYPAESRKVDTANQFYLWAFPRYRFPFDQQDRESRTPAQVAQDADPRARLAWTAFEEMTGIVAGDERQCEIPTGVALFKNSRYLVWKSIAHCPLPPGDGVLLSIRARDRNAAHDWRDFQRLKNELVDPEAEAVELYPAESRRVDSANQFHLWAFPRYRFPFGQRYREVVTPAQVAQDADPRARLAVQRPFEPDDPWNEPTGPVAGSGMYP
jgi:hypothetical protein